MSDGMAAAAAPEIRHRRGELAVEYRWVSGSGAEGELDLGALVREAPAEVHVVLGVPDVGGERDARVVAPWLSAAEAARRERIVHPRARAEFLLGRRLIRGLLGPLVGVAPRDLQLVENEFGAISLADSQRAGWSFNLSHTDGLIAVAVARDAVLGIDVEHTARQGRTVELADRFFARAEVAALHALPEAARRARFFDLWTLKEAYIKARGMGLAMPLGDFAFALDGAHDDGGQVRLSVVPERRDAPDETWRFALADVGTEHRLALVSRPARPA